jgi:hypothetical protein
MLRSLLEHTLRGTVLACVFVTAAAAADSPSSRLNSILEAGRAQRSVHYVTTTPKEASGWQVYVGDASVAIGIQHVTYHAHGKVGHVTVIADPGAAYLRGDAFALNVLGFASAAAKKYASRWILIPKSAKSYARVSAGVMLVSAIDELTRLPLPPPLTLVPETTLNGRRVFGVQAKKSENGPTVAVATLYASATGLPLPVEYVGRAGNERITKVLSNWNAPVRVVIPTGATPISDVQKSPGPVYSTAE